MAIWFNNWNERGKARQIEVQSLRELRDALQQDLEDIKENSWGFQQRVKLFSSLIEHMEQRLPYNDSLQQKLIYLQGFTFLVSNIAPYETLKSRGLETITNDSLRLEIATYYDVNYEIILANEKEHREHYTQYLKPKIMEHFSLQKQQMLPLDYEQMRDDFAFQQTIHWALRTDGYLLELYRQLEKKAQHLLHHLNTEIKRRN